MDKQKPRFSFGKLVISVALVLVVIIVLYTIWAIVASFL